MHQMINAFDALEYKRLKQDVELSSYMHSNLELEALEQMNKRVEQQRREVQT